MTIAKTAKLGMSFGTARARLERDILYALAVQAGHVCHRCAGPLDRSTFSVEHKTPWMQADDPKAAFFSLENVAFSHLRCNTAEMIERRRSPIPAQQRRRDYTRKWRAKTGYDPVKRRTYYERTGT
jgi:hypothetical protein